MFLDEFLICLLAYTSFRTEPQSDIGHTRGGKKMFACQKLPCQGLRCVVAMLASELLRLPAFKLPRLSCEVAMFVCQVPQLSGFKL